MASSNGSKWGESTSLGDKKARVVLLVSRIKDNKDVTDFQARRKAFLTTNTIKELEDTFLDFVRKGVSGEKCRMYLSNNERDMRAIKKELLKHLIDNDDFNLCAIDTKVAAIAATKQCAKGKKWFFDFDIDDEESVYRFIHDIYEIDPLLEITLTRTVNGYAVGTNRGFDTRKLFEKWGTKDVTLKRDDMLLEAVAENTEPVAITRYVHESVQFPKDCNRYEAMLGPNTNQFWIYDSAEDVYIDPPLNILEATNEIRFKNGTETADSISEAETYLENLANQDGDLPWLHDGNEYKDIEI